LSALLDALHMLWHRSMSNNDSAFGGFDQRYTS